MKFSQPSAEIFVPDGTAPVAALARTTHLCLAAHQDDLEIMAHGAIAAARGRADRWFTGVVVTDGAGSPRTGPFAGRTDAEMKAIRREEQRAAARLGGYAAVIQLAHPSAAVKDAAHPGVRADLAMLLAAMTPAEVTLHNPADKHDTHIAVFLRCLAALRALPVERRPARVLGAEVWRGLDWLLAADKVALDDSAEPQLAAELLAVFASQIAGGKRYDLAVAGRRLANATFLDPHTPDGYAALTWAMELTPLVRDPARPVEEFVLGHVDRLRADIAARLRRWQ